MSYQRECSSTGSYRKFGLAMAVLGLIVCGSSPLVAQSGDYGQPAVEAGPRYHHASTIDQGYLDGWAAVYRSVGQARYNSALAARHAQAAYEHALDNALKRVDVYYARKAIRREYVASNARPPLTLERILEHNRMRTPDRLSSRQLSESTGKIYWPPALSDDVFARERDRLDRLFAERTPSNSGRGSRNLREVKQSVDQLMKLVGHRVRSGEIDAQEFGEANRFLRSIKYEAYFVSQNLGLAAN